MKSAGMNWFLTPATLKGGEDMTNEQILMTEHQLISEATEWGAGMEVVFQGYISGVEAMTDKMLELMKDGEQ